MPRASKSKKRPSRICRRWFLPNARLKERQMTCGDPTCKREWHRKKCHEWNRANRDYFRANYLQKKLEAAQCDKAAKAPTRGPPQSLSKSGLPFRFVQEVIGMQHLLIIEYLAQLLMRRFQEVLRGQLVGNTGQTEQLPRTGFSRGDRL
jgi:hypothetical protein